MPAGERGQKFEIMSVGLAAMDCANEYDQLSAPNLPPDYGKMETAKDHRA